MNQHEPLSPELSGLLAAFAARVVQRARPFAVQVADGTYRWRYEDVTAAALLTHMQGEMTLALSSADTQGDTRWLCLDVDDVAPDALSRLLVVRQALAEMGLPGLVEASRRGGHLWLFLDAPLDVATARIAILVALRQLHARGIVLPGYELYPDQAAEIPGTLGHAVRIPLGVHQLTGKRYPLFDEAGNPCAFTSESAAMQYVCAWPDVPASVVRDLANRAVSVAGAGNGGDELVPSLVASQAEQAWTADTADKSGKIGKIGTRSAVIRWVDANVSVLDLLGELAAESEMQRTGQGYLGWCPFHDDRASDDHGRPGTKSLYVVRDRRYGWSWRCLSMNCTQHDGPMRHSFRLFQALTGLTAASAVGEAVAWWPEAGYERASRVVAQLDAEERSVAHATQDSAR
jgi:hypothetical protein